MVRRRSLSYSHCRKANTSVLRLGLSNIVDSAIFAKQVYKESFHEPARNSPSSPHEIVPRAHNQEKTVVPQAYEMKGVTNSQQVLYVFCGNFSHETTVLVPPCCRLPSRPRARCRAYANEDPHPNGHYPAALIRHLHFVLVTTFFFLQFW